MISDYLYIAGDMTGLEDVIMAIILFILLIVFVIWFVDVLSKAFIIKKAGRSFFIGFIPVYNDYVLCDVTGTNKFWFALKYGLPFLVGTIASLNVEYEISLSSLILFSTLGYNIALSASLSKSFGRGWFTTICHILFPQITRFVIASTSEYKGSKGCNDVVFRNPNYTQYVAPVDHPKYSFCPKCGNALTEYDRFCNKCGREI